MKPKTINLLDIAKGTPGMVGADLANLVNEAALLASRKRKKFVDNSDFQEAQDKVLMGVQRKSMVLSDHEKKVTAYHDLTKPCFFVELPSKPYLELLGNRNYQQTFFFFWKLAKPLH
jgi:cell division protease FtsH